MERLLSLFFSEISVEGAYITCYQNMKPQLKINISSPLEVYLPGQEGRGLYKYMMWFHDIYDTEGLYTGDLSQEWNVL
jgi:hypothetical protein